ncbi:MAG: arginine deiminase-related protein [Wenzhouxiangellaceae bacterium]
MIVSDPQELRQQLEAGWLQADAAAVPRGVFMVEPADFRLSRQAATDNSYMDLSVTVDPARAMAQHRALGEAISGLGIPVVRFPGRSETPDDVFPNNVFATAPGRFIVGSMCHPERRLEATRTDIRAFFTRLMAYPEFDLSRENCVAELTGSLVIDRARRIGFCGMSTRVDDAGCRAMHQAFDLALTFRFDLKPDEYHTNVVMSVLASRALVICPDAFADPAAPEAIAAAFPGRVVEIGVDEKNAFAANCIALTADDLFISATGWEALRPGLRERLSRELGFRIHAMELDEIEKAGGSLRCCIGEIF